MQAKQQKVNYSDDLIIAGDFNEDLASTMEAINKARNFNLVSVHTELT